MANNEKTTGIPIDDDALDKAVGGIKFPLTEEDIRNITPEAPMNPIDTNVLKINLDPGVVQVGGEHKGPSCDPITGKPIVKTLIK